MRILPFPFPAGCFVKRASCPDGRGRSYTSFGSRDRALSLSLPPFPPCVCPDVLLVRPSVRLSNRPTARQALGCVQAKKSVCQRPEKKENRSGEVPWASRKLITSRWPINRLDGLDDPVRYFNVSFIHLVILAMQKLPYAIISMYCNYGSREFF